MASMKTAFIWPHGLAVLFVAEAWEFDAFCADRWFFSDPAHFTTADESGPRTLIDPVPTPAPAANPTRPNSRTGGHRGAGKPTGERSFAMGINCHVSERCQVPVSFSLYLRESVRTWRFPGLSCLLIEL
jgi:hypothetical protein